MISFFQRHKKPIFVVTTAMFLAAIFVGLGGYFFSSSSSGAVAVIGSKKIMYKDFLRRVNLVLDRLSENGTQVDEAMRNGVKQEVFRNMMVEEILSEEARKYGMIVSDFEIAAEVQNTPQFRYNGAFNPRVYYNTVWSQFQMTPSDYENWRKKARLSSNFREFMYSTIKITPAELVSYYLFRKEKIKDFEKKKEEYRRKLLEEKFMRIMNYYLLTLTSKTEIRNYLKEREEGR